MVVEHRTAIFFLVIQLMFPDFCAKRHNELLMLFGDADYCSILLASFFAISGVPKDLAIPA